MEELFKKIDDGLKKINERLDNLTNDGLMTYNSGEVQKILKISKRTLQTLRDEDKIKFSQDGNVIRYTPAQINDYLRKHEKKGIVINMLNKKRA